MAWLAMLAFLTTELAFFTTEHAEEKPEGHGVVQQRSNDIAPRRQLRGARSYLKKLPLQFSVALRLFLRVLRGSKGRRHEAEPQPDS